MLPVRPLLLILIAFGLVPVVIPPAGAETVAAFLKRCDPPKDASLCRADIDSASDMLQIKDDKTFCPPDLAKLSDSQIIANWAAAMTWLKKRPGNEDVDQALMNAWRARYPCRKP
jgi:hypothetical protein